MKYRHALHVRDCVRDTAVNKIGRESRHHLFQRKEHISFTDLCYSSFHVIGQLITSSAFADILYRPSALSVSPRHYRLHCLDEIIELAKQITDLFYTGFNDIE